MRDRTEELLHGVPLFAGLSNSGLRQVAMLATGIDLPAGSQLTRQGDMGAEFVIVIDGSADVSIDGNVVATCGPGEFFGEMALLEGRRQRVATVVAKTDVSLEVISRQDFSILLDDFPGIAATLRATMEARATENEAFTSD